MLIDSTFEGQKSKLTALAGNGSKIKDVKLAALCDSAAAKGRVGLSHDDGSAGDESEDGGRELHGESRLLVCFVCLCDVVRSEWIVEGEELWHEDLESSTYSLLFEMHRQRLIPDVALETRQDVNKIARSNSATPTSLVSLFHQGNLVFRLI